MRKVWPKMTQQVASCRFVFLLLLSFGCEFVYGDVTPTDDLIRDILENRTTLNNDALALEQLLIAANQSKPTMKTWQTIEAILANSEPFSNDSLTDDEVVKGRTVKRHNPSNVTINKISGKLESAINEFPADFMSDKVCV